MKAWKWFAVVAAVGIALGTGSVAYAQEEAPLTGCGLRLGRGRAQAQPGSGLLHEYLVEAFAERLDLTPEAIEERLAAGDTMAQIALDEGVSIESFRSLWLEVRQQAVAEALADGILTPEQADWLSQKGWPAAPGPSGAARCQAAAHRWGLAQRSGASRP